MVHAETGRVFDDVVEEAGAGRDLQVVPVDGVKLFLAANLPLEELAVGEADDCIL